MYKKFIILIILLIISCIYFYREKFDNYGLKLETCTKDKDTHAICINKINQDTMGYSNKGTTFNKNLNNNMPIIYPFVPKNNNNCKGLLQNWNDRGCDDQCKELGYEYYRSDLDGCVNNLCIPSVAACTDPTFLTTAKCKQDVCSDNKILLNTENNNQNNNAQLSNIYNYIPINNIDNAMPNVNEYWRKIPNYMCSTNYTYKNAGKGGAEQCKKYCLEREDKCQDGYSYLYNYGWNQCRFAKKEYGRCNKGTGGQGDHYYKVAESDPCLKKTDKWCLDNRPKKYKWGRKLPGLASQGQSTPEWRCYSDQSLTPDKSKFNESSPVYWTSPDLQKVWDNCKNGSKSESKPIECSSDFGKTGEPCCGVTKATMGSSNFSDLTAEHTCSKDLPKCEGYRPGYTWGTCKAAPKPVNNYKKVKSCRNPLANQDLQCVDLKNYLRKSSGLGPNGGETQNSLNNCTSWVGEGGQWIKDYNNTCKPVNNYTITKAPRETVGKHLKGSGKQAWPGSVEQALKIAYESYGLKPGITLRYIQNSGGRAYFYAGGNVSGKAGSENWRIDPR